MFERLAPRLAKSRHLACKKTDCVVLLVDSCGVCCYVSCYRRLWNVMDKTVRASRPGHGCVCARLCERCTLEGVERTLAKILAERNDPTKRKTFGNLRVARARFAYSCVLRCKCGQSLFTVQLACTGMLRVRIVQKTICVDLQFPFDWVEQDPIRSARKTQRTITLSGGPGKGPD